MKIGANATISELGVEDSVGSDELGFDLRFDRLRDDRIVFMVVEYHEVLAAATRVDGGAASLVREDFISQFDCLDKNLVGLDWEIMLAWEDNRGWCE